MRADSGGGGGGRRSCLGKFTAGHFCVTGKRKLWKQTGAGQELISSPRLKAHLSRQRGVIEGESGGSPHANGGAITRGGKVGEGADVDTEDDEEDSVSDCNYHQTRRWGASAGTDGRFLG